MRLPPIYGAVTSILTAPITAILGRNPVLIGQHRERYCPVVGGFSAGIGGIMLISQLTVWRAISRLRPGRCGVGLWLGRSSQVAL